MKKRPDISEQTIDNLKTAFWKLYEQKPVSHITVKEITDLSGYNRGTFYLYFKDVYDILEQVEEEILLSTKENFKLITDSLQNPQMVDLMSFALTISKKHDKHMSVLLGEHGDPKFEATYKQITKEFLRHNLENSIDRDELKSEYLFEFFVSGLIGTIRLWHSRDEDLPVADFSQIIIGFYSNNF